MKSRIKEISSIQGEYSQHRQQFKRYFDSKNLR